ncbi:G2/mitotic-specific cyclin-B2 [Diabrotica virgifera virgifera]|uniref:G2/mitotic-specific cyclin-B2 n=1 Tax=Diabrotica virgifera virgifera TaxID=50390 RepID=A0A6P7FZW2_DIAVI|nr:G2/mitotic-specific cyclin-B2 [Diabrotica virgifera virgifera]XP_028142163.1 G2/mitotic-specific cyclin-B2 [Diabrotica virgifera virgifera]
MAAPRRAAQTVNQENVNSRLAVKSNVTAPLEPLKRPALGELGNTLQDTQKAQNGLAPTKDGFKKPEGTLQPKKETIKTLTNKEKAIPIKPRTILKRQESLVKPLQGKCTQPKEVPRTSTLVNKKLSIVDPDESSKNDPQMVTEYVMDIFKYLRDMELKLAIKDNFLKDHETTSRMRAILVNWLVDVHANFKATLDTLHICIGIVDRYLQANKKVGRNTLQLVGASAMLIACKYEEIYVPELDDFEYVCDHTFTKRQILQMEREILKGLDFSLGRPISVQFLRRYTKVTQSRVEHHNLGKYMLELVLLESDLVHVRPSLLAAAACCLSIGILNETMDLPKLWNPTCVQYTSYNYNDFKSIITELAYLLVKSEQSKFQAIRRKYALAKFGKISLNVKLNGPLVRKLTAGKK